MAWIEKHGNRYRVGWRDRETNQKMYRSFRDKPAANRHAAAVEADATEPDLVDLLTAMERRLMEHIDQAVAKLMEARG